MYDGECLAKAEEMGKPGLVTIKQRQVRRPDTALMLWDNRRSSCHVLSRAAAATATHGCSGRCYRPCSLLAALFVARMVLGL